MCVCAGLEDNINFYDHMIDSSYGRLTEVKERPCKKHITYEEIKVLFV
jgi:hypothetical protein